jgi:hypothetical protein
MLVTRNFQREVMRDPLVLPFVPLSLEGSVATVSHSVSA